MDQRRVHNGGTVDGNLIRTLSQQHFKIINSTDAAAHSEGNKYIGRYIPYHVHHSIAIIRGSGNIQKNHFVRTGRIIGLCDLHRITGISQIDKIHTFNDPAVIHIQTGNNSLCKHLIFPPCQ